VINKRAGGIGLISGRKAFQRPMAEGVELLNAIQDVYLDGFHHHRLNRRPNSTPWAYHAPRRILYPVPGSWGSGRAQSVTRLAPTARFATFGSGGDMVIADKEPC